jgi:Tol biopolymer transport system component
VRRKCRILTYVASLLAILAMPSTVCADDDTLVFTVKRWKGEYESNDMKATPSTEAIWSIRADGSELKELASMDGAVCAAPGYSPDGKWLYFQSNASGAYQLYRCKADGTQREQLTSPGRPGCPCKSAYGVQVTSTGQLLCAAITDSPSPCVAVISPDGARVKLVAPHLGYLYMSAMSPRGDTVVVSGPASGYRLWLLKLPDAYRTDDSRLTKPSVDLAPDQPESFAPRFTPDGRTITYLRRDGDLYRVQADGSGRRQLTNGNGYCEFHLSPKDRHGSTDGYDLSTDGKRIAYVAIREGVPNVCVINIDGSGAKQLTFRKTPCARVRWNPDGSRIAFVSFEQGKYPQLFVISAAGGQPRKLTQMEGAVYSIGPWKPTP